MIITTTTTNKRKPDSLYFTQVEFQLLILFTAPLHILLGIQEAQGIQVPSGFLVFNEITYYLCVIIL